MRADTREVLALFVAGLALGAVAWTIVPPAVLAAVAGVITLLIVALELRGWLIDAGDRRRALERWEAWRLAERVRRFDREAS